MEKVQRVGGNQAVAGEQKTVKKSGRGGIVSKNQTSNGATNYKMRSPDEILEDVRQKIIGRGTPGILGVKRCFKQRDEDESGALNF